MQEIIQFGFLKHKYMQTQNKTRNAVIFTLNKEGIHKNKKVRNAKIENLEKFLNFAIFVFSNCHSCGMMITEDVIKP